MTAGYFRKRRKRSKIIKNKGRGETWHKKDRKSAYIYFDTHNNLCYRGTLGGVPTASAFVPPFTPFSAVT